MFLFSVFKPFLGYFHCLAFFCEVGFQKSIFDFLYLRFFRLTD